MHPDLRGYLRRKLGYLMSNYKDTNQFRKEDDKTIVLSKNDYIVHKEEMFIEE